MLYGQTPSRDSARVVMCWETATETAPASLGSALTMRSTPVGPKPKTRTFAESLIDREEDKTLRAALIGMLLERRPGVNVPSEGGPS